MKKLIKLFVLIVFLLMSTVNVNAIIISGSCGDGVTYTLNDDYSLVIEGNGKMTDYSVIDYPWNSYRDKIIIVEIKEGVKSIGNYAFYDCYSLKSVAIGNSVTSIGNYAFQNCSSLLSVTIPNSVTSIGNCAFLGCSALTTVIIGNSVESIGQEVFSDCSALTTVTIPNSVTSIGYGAFKNTSIKKEIIWNGNLIYFPSVYEGSYDIPNSVTSIGGYAFNGCFGLTSVNIPNSVMDIGIYAFYGCSGLTSVNIPNSVTNIGMSAFNGCSGLTSVKIPNSMTSIDHSVFYGCSGLTSVTIPNLVKSIGGRAFEGCSALRSVTNLAKIPQQIGYYAFSTYGTLHVLPGCKEAYAAADYWKKFTIVDDVEVPLLVENISFDKDSYIIKPGETLTLTPAISPTDSSNRDLMWTSSDKNIATVADGIVKGVGGGMVSITATATDGSDVKATCKVIVDGPFAGYNHYLESDNTGKYSMIQVGSYITKSIGFYIENIGKETVNIDKVYVYKNNGALVTSTDDQSVLGKLSAGNNISLSFSVHEDIPLDNYYYVWNYTYKGKSCVKKSNESPVTIPVYSIFLDTHNATLKVSEKRTLKADILPTIASNKEIAWTSSDTKIATVDDNGVVTAVAVGKATIKATSKYDSKIFDECEVTVEATPVSSIQLSKNDVKLEEGESVTLTATVSPATATVKDVTWTSSNEDVAMVSKSGKVLAVKAGTATITAMATDGSGVKATATVTVTPVTVKSIALNHTSYSLEKGESVTLEVAIAPANAANKKVTWSSSNEDVVMVSSNGKCICLGEGTATVTATTTDGSNLSATCVFNCTDGIITITMDDDSDIKVYDIEGRKLSNLKKGVNIIRMDDGTTRKVVKK